MDVKKTYATDKKKEKDGFPVDFGNGCECGIARWGNPVYDKAFNDLSEPHSAKLRRGTLDDEASAEIFCRSMARGILRWMTGLKEDGVLIEDTEDERTRILIAYPDFRMEIERESKTRENFKLYADEDGQGN